MAQTLVATNIAHVFQLRAEAGRCTRVRLIITRSRTKLLVCKSRREREGARQSSKPAPVFVTILKSCRVEVDFEKRRQALALRNCLARSTKLFSNELVTADSSCRSGFWKRETATAWLAGSNSARRVIILYRCCVLNDD